MIRNVTFLAKGNNIKGVFGFIPVPVVPEFCLIATVLAKACFSTLHTARLDFTTYGIAGFESVWMLISRAFVASFASGLAFFRPVAFRTMSIALASDPVTVSTSAGPAKFTRLAFGKVLKFFRDLAVATCFDYDRLRHVSIPFQLIRVRAICGSHPVSGLFISADHTNNSPINNRI